MKKLVAFFTERSLLVNIISIGLLLAGIISVFSSNREAFPLVEYNWVIATTVYPGATPADIEKHITIPIEDQIKEVDGIEEIYSESNESRSVVAVKLDMDLEDFDKTVNDIKNAIDLVSDIPEEAEDTLVMELGTDLVHIVEVSVMRKKGINSDADERELRRHAKILEDRILEIDGVAKIEKKGYRDREMVVEVHPHLLDKYHIGLNEIIMALAQKNLNFPGGLVQTADEDIMIRTIGEVETARDISNVLIRANDMGNWVRIGDVATVNDSFDEAEIINKTNGEKSVTLNVYKKETADIIDVMENIDKDIKVFTKKYDKEYTVAISNDLSYYVKRRLKVLLNNSFVGLALVLLSLFITLGWRISVVTALGVPLAFCGTFIWMKQYGVTINLMSMFGLIIVLGMLVDDAIIVAENVYRHLEEGEPPKEAVLNGTSEVIIPVLGTILTTIAAFSPLMFMTGIMGKFMWTLPAVVIVALVSSWLEAMFILPSHILDLEKRRKEKVKDVIKEGSSLYFRIRDKYVSMLAFVLQNKWKFALMVTIVFFGTMLFAKFNLKFILFPKGKIERFIIKAEAKTGTSLEKMEEKISLLEKIVGKIPKVELDNYISQVGILSEQPMDPNEKRGSNYGTVIVNLTPEETRERRAVDIMDDFRFKAKKYESEFEKLEVVTSGTGPPTGKAVNAAIMGDDFNTLKKISNEFQAYLHEISEKFSYNDGKKKIPALKDIQDNYEEGKRELQVFVDEKTAQIAGISVYDVATTIRTCFKGTVATKIKKTDEEIDIRVVFPEKYRDDLNTLKLVKVLNTKTGYLVPLSEIATFKYDRGISVVNRQSWKRAITVTADIDEHAERVTSMEVNNMLMKKFKNIYDRYPGVVVDYLGEFKDTQESIDNLMRSFIVAFIIIYIILVALFRSLGHPFVIVNVIPLTSIGVIWTFYIHDKILSNGLPLSFLALMGVVGLTGVVVNDSIVMVDFIKRARAQGFSPYDASLMAGGQRLRAVFLTTITTFFGLIPTAYGIGGNDPFLKPMAISLSWGLLFGTVITLFITPLLYNMLSDVRKFLFRRDKPAESYAVIEDYYEHEMEEKIKGVVEEDIKTSMEREIRDLVEQDVQDCLEKGINLVDFFQNFFL